MLINKIYFYYIVLFPILVFPQNYTKDISKLMINTLYKTTVLTNSIIKIEKSLNDSPKYVNIADQQIAISSFDEEMQLFDLINTNDSLYANMFDSISTILVGGFSGYPMIIGDFNQNGILDIAGSYRIKTSQDLIRTAIFEQQNNVSFSLEKLYDDSLTKPLAITDLDNDGLIELNIRRRHHFYNFENRTPYSYPDSLNLIYQMWQISSSIGSETFIDMYNDNIMDVIYVGDDSLPPSGQKIYIAEYDSSSNSFIKKYSNRPEDWRVSGISTGDFDNDGYKEFVTGAIHGHVYVYENTGPDNYQLTFEDSLPTPNVYLNCATNDMDNNGKRELFIGGSSYYWGVSGTWVFWYESDSNNDYKIVRSFFLVGTGVLGTTELYSYDVNNDGKLDLVFAFAEYVVILVWNNDTNEFEMFYFNYINKGYTEVQSVNIYDVDKDGGPDLFISLNNSNTEPIVRSYYYKSNLLTTLGHQVFKPNKSFYLYQNYPNPFNPNTTISFSIPKSGHVLLEIYNTLGQKIFTLIDKKLSAGNHIIGFDGKGLSSGVYLYKIQTSDYFDVKKMIYLK